MFTDRYDGCIGQNLLQALKQAAFFRSYVGFEKHAKRIEPLLAHLRAALLTGEASTYCRNLAVLGLQCNDQRIDLAVAADDSREEQLFFPLDMRQDLTGDRLAGIRQFLGHAGRRTFVASDSALQELRDEENLAMIV